MAIVPRQRGRDRDMQPLEGKLAGLLAAADERDDTTAIRFAFASPGRG